MGWPNWYVPGRGGWWAAVCNETGTHGPMAVRYVLDGVERVDRECGWGVGASGIGMCCDAGLEKRMSARGNRWEDEPSLYILRAAV